MRKKKLLLVGDAGATARILDAAGFDVTAAPSAREAAAMIDGYVPDLILFDGLDVPDALAGLGIPIVRMAEATGPEPASSRKIIYKPCRPRTLIERVEHVLRYDR